MKRFHLFTAFFFFICSVSSAQQLHYRIDDSHSQIKTIGLLGNMMEVEGKFGNFWGDVFFDPEHPEKLSVTIFIDPSSLDTDNEWRDKHLQDEDFLHTEAYDKIVFKSTAVIIDQSLSGQLLLKGKERNVSLVYEKTFGPMPDPWGNSRVTFSGSFTFSRSDFMLGPTEGFWGNSIGDEAQVVFTISATRRNTDRMSMLKNEKVAAIWENLAAGNSTAAIADIDSMLAEADEKTKKQLIQMIDLLAKRLRQYEHEEAYLLMLSKNVEAFPETDWVHSNQALGFWETRQPEAAIEAAKRALQLNPKNTLAMELLK